MGKHTLADTIREITRHHLEQNNGLLLGQALSAVGWVNNTVPNCRGIIELPMTDVAGAGIAVGTAMVGRRPIFVIRFQDFLILNGSPLIFYAAKSKELHGKSTPIFVRAIAADGMGPVHSGVIHNIFMHFPGFRVCSPMTPNEYSTIWNDFMTHDDPMIVSEHRNSFLNTEELDDIIQDGASITLYPISATRFEAVKAVEKLAKEGIICNVVHIVWLKPFVAEERLIKPLQQTKLGLVIDAGHEICGASQSIAYQLTQATGLPVRALALKDRTKCLCHPLRNEIPSAERIAETVRNIHSKSCAVRNKYQNGIVKKPWGYEYLMYQSEKIAIWHLYIAEGCKTSLHCHPTKKTGYILLSGEAEVSFLRNTLYLKAISKLMIREGLFHSTKAVSPGGIHIIEVESPPDKTNLVRLEDAYGRQGQPYEGTDAIVSFTEDCVRFVPPKPGNPATYSTAGVDLVIEHIDDMDLLKDRPQDEVILVIEGGLVSENGDQILGPGDVITISTFLRLYKTFKAPKGMSIMSARKGKDYSRC